MSAREFTPEALPHWDAAFLERAEVRHEYSLSAHLGDKAMHARKTPSRALQARCVRGAAAGLVPVPTTLQHGESASQKGLSAQLAAANVVAARKGLACEVGSFVLDAPARRLSSLRMMVGMAARAHAVSEKGSRSDVAWMETMTYAPGNTWRSDQLGKAMQKCRNWCVKKGIAFRYVWIAEVQDERLANLLAAGVPRSAAMVQCIHYHAVIWLPVGVKCPRFDNRGWWPHGATRTDAPPEQVKHPAAYLMHYLKKDKDLAALPKGARAYGVGGLDHSLRRARRWLRLPAFVQGNSSINDKWERAEGGGWLSPSGVRFSSEFTAVVVGGIRSLVRVATHHRSIEAAGPFSWCSDRFGVLS